METFIHHYPARAQRTGSNLLGVGFVIELGIVKTFYKLNLNIGMWSSHSSRKAGIVESGFEKKTTR